MKYYHIIYTSSQKGLSGGNGFGIRTATEGIPQEYLKVINDGVHSSKYINNVEDCRVPKATELIDTKGGAICNVPPRYFYFVEEVAEGKTVYLIGRNICLGFTEAFYYPNKEGKPSGGIGRMGNYIIDFYLFEEKPPREAFQIFYEKPAPGSQRFVPTDPSPRVDNTEMIQLSTGDPVMLPKEEKPFLSVQTTFSPEVVDLLFAIVDARLKGVSLVVKCPWEKANGLIADVVRLLPDNLVGGLTFSTQYTGNGYSTPADVNFVNEYYKAQYIGKGVFADLEAGAVQTREAAAFRQNIVDAIQGGDLPSVHQLVDWMLSPTYQQVANLSAYTNNVLFTYSQRPKEFKLQMLHAEKQHEDELLKALSAHIQASAAAGSPFFDLLEQEVGRTTAIEVMIQCVSRMEQYKRCGLDVDKVKRSQTEHIGDVLMASPQNVVLAIQQVGLPLVRQYTNDLAKGRTAPELAPAFLEIYKGQTPGTLDAAAKVTAHAKENSALLNLLTRNFALIFGGVYEQVVTAAAAGKQKEIAATLDSVLLSPFRGAKGDKVFDQFDQLYQVLTDNAACVTKSSFSAVYALACKLKMTGGELGKALQRFIIEELPQERIGEYVGALKTVWGLNAKAILNRVKTDLQSKPNRRKTFFMATLENSNYKLEDALTILKMGGFTEADMDLYLTKSPKFNAAYKKYKRKQWLGNLWKGFLGLFKGKKKKATPKTQEHKNAKTQTKLTLLVGLMLLMAVGQPTSAWAQDYDYHAAYGDQRDAYPVCYILQTNSLNVRTSPSVYKGRSRYNTRKDNLAFSISQGDTIFVASGSDRTTADDITWISFMHGGTTYYAAVTNLAAVSNPHFVTDENVDVGAVASTIEFVRKAAPWTLLVFALIIGFLIYVICNENKWLSFAPKPRSSTGMRPVFVFSLPPYMYFVKLSFIVLGALCASVLLMLVIGGFVWGILWVVKILMWILIIVGWILLIVGIICLFANPFVGIILAAIGGFIVYKQDGISEFGDQCVATGLAFFDALNMWNFSLELAQQYWKVALAVALAPLALFLVVAILILIVAGIMRAYEFYTTRRYNVKHPCPFCHEPSEPAIYYDGESEEGKLPCNLRPGIYGLLHITHPVTGTAMPTLIANGRDRLMRKCPHCDRFINFEAGTEKHIGFIGFPESGKTTLMCSVIAQMRHTYSDMHFTDSVDSEIVNIENFMFNEGHLDTDHLPGKTDVKLKSSVQCILPRFGGGMPYHLYFNDVAGELFQAGSFNANLMLFARDVESIVFIVDPLTMQLEPSDLSDEMQTFFRREDIQRMISPNTQDIKNAMDALVMLLGEGGAKRKLADIDFTFALAKSDLGYMDHIDKTDSEALRTFMQRDLRLGNLVNAAETQFKSVSYYAVSVFNHNDYGLGYMSRKIASQLKINE